MGSFDVHVDWHQDTMRLAHAAEQASGERMRGHCRRHNAELTDLRGDTDWRRKFTASMQPAKAY